MHIKAIIIEGFKTYKELTRIDDFDPAQNIILGKNGSGKSNIFDAIQFVLSDKYAKLHQSERQRLLHEGSGREIMTASVEIIFDNSDGRFPISDKPEVSIKRTIGLKKDEYFLDNKHNSKQEVMNLLESAGLSKSNPYYIVQQGQVRRLIKMKPSERLELFKDIAGTRTYDERRKESLKIMSDTDKRRAQIDEVTTYIETRLTELEEEKKELKEFQDLDSHRRCLEYTIYDQELKDATSKLDVIEGGKGDTSGKTGKLHEELAEAKAIVADSEENIRQLTEDLAKYKAQKQQWEREREKGLKRRAKVDLQVRDEQSKVTGNKAQKKEVAAEVAELQAQISKTTAKLASAMRAHKEKTLTESALKDQITSLEQTLSTLYDKQGRKDQFKSKGERDTFLKAQIKDIKKTEENERKQLGQIAAANEKLSKSLATTAALQEKKAGEMEDLKKQHDDMNSEYTSRKDQRDAATNDRKELWRQQSGVDGGLQELQRELDKKETELRYSMEKTLFIGLEQVKKITADLKLKGVHGPLVHLFECEEKFRHCVEVTAGNSLFNIVVDSDITAATIIKEMNKQKQGGRVTFIPLNRLHEKEVAYPKSTDVIPMIERLTFEEKYRKAMSQVFGKTLVARNLTVGAEVASSANFNTITLQGDQVNKKGALTGGYSEHKHSRIQIVRAIQALEAEVETKKQAEADIKATIIAQDAKVTAALAAIEKLHEKRTHLKNQYQLAQLDLSKWKKERAVEEDEFNRNERVIAEMKLQIARHDAKLKALEGELGSEFVDKLSAEDQATLMAAQKDLAESKKKLLVASSARAEAETERKRLEDLLESNLLKRQDELESVMQSEEATEASQQLEKDQHELGTIDDLVQELEDNIKGLEKNIEATTKSVGELHTKLEKAKRAEEEAERTLQKESKTFEKLLSKRSTLVKKRDDCTKSIRDLGSLPAEALTTKYTKLTQAQLMSKLETVNGQLKKYSHVNKKAMDQYVGFTDQRADLLARKAELDKGRKAILDLISTLDIRKDEAIQRTFKGIAKHFSTVFSELVPEGKGTLVIQTTKKDGDGDELEGSDEEEEKKGRKGADEGIRAYSGVSIKVSFTGAKSGDQTMMQLSGGQQSVVALSLIFAIQRCDPSPFYLFDEIDSNLDAVHRTSLARMITKQCKDTQFICTTFRPEMLTHANKFYGVTFNNKVSQVNVIDKEDAKELILVVEKEMTTAAKSKDTVSMHA